MLNTLFTAMALLFIVAMLLQIFTIQAFFNVLEKKHKKLYDEMYRPKWRIQLANDAFREGLKYIRSQKFRELDDSDLERLYKQLKRVDYAAIVFGVVAAAIVLYQAISYS